jgi:hypothetical protein
LASNQATSFRFPQRGYSTTASPNQRALSWQDIDAAATVTLLSENGDERILCGRLTLRRRAGRECRLRAQNIISAVAEFPIQTDAKGREKSGRALRQCPAPLMPRARSPTADSCAWSSRPIVLTCGMATTCLLVASGSRSSIASPEGLKDEVADTLSEPSGSESNPTDVFARVALCGPGRSGAIMGHFL